jgi:hypothetical protein
MALVGNTQGDDARGRGRRTPAARSIRRYSRRATWAHHSTLTTWSQPPLSTSQRRRKPPPPLCTLRWPTRFARGLSAPRRPPHTHTHTAEEGARRRRRRAPLHWTARRVSLPPQPIRRWTTRWQVPRASDLNEPPRGRCPRASRAALSMSTAQARTGSSGSGPWWALRPIRRNCLRPCSARWRRRRRRRRRRCVTPHVTPSAYSFGFFSSPGSRQGAPRRDFRPDARWEGRWRIRSLSKGPGERTSCFLRGTKRAHPASS